VNRVTAELTALADVMQGDFLEIDVEAQAVRAIAPECGGWIARAWLGRDPGPSCTHLHGVALNTAHAGEKVSVLLQGDVP
jgi:hypothetical protein